MKRYSSKSAPSVTAPAFRAAPAPRWREDSSFLRFKGKPLSPLWSTIQTQMPLNAPGTLSSAQSLAVVAFILQKNGFPAGASPIVGHYDAMRIVPAVAPGKAAGAPTVAATPHVMVVEQPSTNVPSQQELETPDSGDWPMYGRDYGASRYSGLDDITSANVSGLRRVCSIQLSGPGSFQAGPVAYGGTLYATTTTDTFAIDGRTCAKLWEYRYKATDIDAGANNKGVAIGDGRAIRGTTDGHLIALDLKTGGLLWDRKIMDSSSGASALAAPLIWRDLVFMGTAGGEVGVGGELSAYRVTDGMKVWSLYTVRSPLQRGGGIWTYFSLDPKIGMIFVPVGNPGPDFDASVRPGADQFSTGIVAVDATSGTLRWAYQTEPNDDHDWDATGSAEFSVSEGKQIVAATSKDGLLHLLDVSGGRLLSKTPTTTIANAAAQITPSGTHYCRALRAAASGTERRGPGYGARLRQLG